jgi:hypothetical protein
MARSNLNYRNYDASYEDVVDEGVVDDGEISESFPEIEFDADGNELSSTEKPREDHRIETKIYELSRRADEILAADKQQKKAANDNCRIKESWHLRDAITKGHYGETAEDKAMLLRTMRRIQYLVDEVHRDPLGLSVHAPGKDLGVDYDIEKSPKGKVLYGIGLSLDRKARIAVSGNGETNKKYNGPIRKAAKSGPVDNSGFDPHRDNPIAFRKIEARQELDEIVVLVGPLWEHLRQAVCENATATDVGIVLGYSGTRASAVGIAMVKLGLETATKAIELCKMVKDEEPYTSWLKKQPDHMPLPARRLKRALRIIQQN